MVSNTAFTVLVVVILLLQASACEGQKNTFFIRPSNSSHYPEEINTTHCYDLTTFSSEKHLFVSANISLLFLHGDHYLDYDFDIRNAEEFQMLPFFDTDGSDSEIYVRITCNSNTSLVIQNVSFVNVYSMSFHSCGVDVDSSGALQLRSVYHCEITNSKWYGSRSSAVYIEQSNAVVSDCLFMNGNCSRCSGGGFTLNTVM